MTKPDPRLAALIERANILGIDIAGIEDSPEQIQARISSYQMKSASNAARRRGFSKTATAITRPEETNLPPEAS